MKKNPKSKLQNKKMSEYYVYSSLPELPQQPTVEEIMNFLDKTHEIIECAREAGADPLYLQQQRQFAWNLILNKDMNLP